MRLSVIIPAYRRFPLTLRHIEEVMKANRKPDEIIVVNDGGDPSLRELILGLNRTQPIHYARVEEDILWNYNGACNLGLWISTGDIIALEDCDHIPSRDAYDKGLAIFEKDPTIDRVSFARRIVQIATMDKPMEEWTDTGNMGPNQMVGMMRRIAWLKLKGQDERFGGHYGYMAYDLPFRRDKVLGAKVQKENYYWAVLGDQGEPGLQRGLSKHNRRLYHENANSGKLHPVNGILNFHFTYEIL